MVSTLKRPSRLAAIVAVPVLLAAGAPYIGGTSYDFVVKSTSTQTGNRESVIMRGRGTFAGGSARLELTEAGQSSDMFGPKGSYFLIPEGGEKMYLVDPSQKSYLEWDMESMMAGMAKLVNALGSMVKMEISDVNIAAQEMGAGEAVQGYPTRHVRMTQNYTVTAHILGKTSVSKNESTTDYYFAPSLKSLKNPFVKNGQNWANKFDVFKNPEYKQQMAAAQAKIQGVPLKTVTTTVTTNEKGKQETSITTTEMVNFKNMDVPASLFAIPTGYQLVQMPSVDMPSTAAMKDSNSAEGAPSVKDATKEVTKDAAKEAAKKKLKGIFKR
ncbi:MAG TPA: hypothetical protein VIF83_09210 [Gemmatimonadaceae bacterium]|jgi:hypothetical protein